MKLEILRHASLSAVERIATHLSFGSSFKLFTAQAERAAYAREKPNMRFGLARYVLKFYVSKF